MAKLTKMVLTALGASALLAGCATGPYDYGYGGYGYDQPYYGSQYYGNPYYADPYYYGPTVGFGYSYSESDRRWRDGNGNWRERRENWRDRDQVRRDENGNVITRDTRQWIDRSMDQVGGPNTDRRRGESGG